MGQHSDALMEICKLVDQLSVEEKAIFNSKVDKIKSIIDGNNMLGILAVIFVGASISAIQEKEALANEGK